MAEKSKAGLTPLQAAFKRAFDLLVSVFLLLLLAPLFLLVALWIKLDSPGPIFFKQKRVGKNEKEFNFWKFRTMIVGAEKGAVEVSAADSRITRSGRFLRATCLDELPQLFNVLKGEMSLVGPRPTLQYQVDKYTPQQKRRLLLLPGMTGLAQVKGRNLIPWEKRIQYDLEYLDNYSFGRDLTIILGTFSLLLRGTGVYGQGGELAKVDNSKKEGDLNL